MCLYPRVIKNPKYTENKKNGGIVPIPKDFRTLYVPIGCGNCIECRRQKANAWKTRLCEELKSNNYAYFVTLTFSNESLQEISKAYECEDVNKICKHAIRHFLERWRKDHKVSLRHWLITELGHENTERIHLHGIIFHNKPITNDYLQRYWKYGRTDTGKFCNEHTINYIVKYVLKIDTDHKQYKPQIFASPGIGRTYTDNERVISGYKYIKGRTREHYLLPNGSKISLPIYYRNKIFDEETREKLWIDRLDKHKIYVMGIECPNMDTEEGRARYDKLLAEQQQFNIQLGYGDNSPEWSKKEYNLTLKMLNKRTK